MPKISFQCEKCDKVFKRVIDLTRHKARKIPCNRDLKCDRCFKEFTKICDLKNHLSRKFLCDNKKEELELQLEIKDKDLKIEEEKTKQKDKDLKIEEEKTKQEEEKTKQVKLEKGTVTNNNCDVQNIFGNQINNIINIDQVAMVKTLCQWEAQKLIESGNVEETLGRMVAFQFNNDKHPENKCIKVHEGELYSKINDIVVEFKKAKFVFNTLIKSFCNDIEFNYGKFSEDEMDKYGSRQRAEHLSDDESSTIKRVDQFVGNNRNNGYVENVIKVNV